MLIVLRKPCLKTGVRLVLKSEACQLIREEEIKITELWLVKRHDIHSLYFNFKMHASGRAKSLVHLFFLCRYFITTTLHCSTFLSLLYFFVLREKENCSNFRQNGAHTHTTTKKKIFDELLSLPFRVLCYYRMCECWAAVNILSKIICFIEGSIFLFWLLAFFTG